MNNGLFEKDINLIVARMVAEKLSFSDFKVILTRSDDSYLSISERTEIANESNADYFLSIHCNAGGGTGFESFIMSGYGGLKTDNRRKIIHDHVLEVCQEYGLIDRGQKQNNFGVLRLTDMSACLLELAFIDNEKDAQVLINAKFQEEVSSAIAVSIAAIFDVVPVPVPKGTRILGPPEATLNQARQFLKEKAPNWQFIADLYWTIASIYNVRPDVALAQACKETAYFRYTGAVKPEMNNYCGLKTAVAAGDKTYDHATFPDKATGVEAHIQHLFAYASTEAIPEGRAIVDPRFEIVAKWVGRGVVATVEELGGRWAPSKDYGISIVNDYLKKLLSVEVSEEPDYKELYLMEKIRADQEKARADNEKARADQYVDRVREMEEIITQASIMFDPYVTKKG